MSLISAPVTLSSLPALYTLRLSGDASDPLTSALFPNAASLASVAHFVKQSEKEMRDPKSTSRLMQMVDSETGEVVCFNAWAFFVKGVASEEGMDFVEEWPEDTHTEAMEHLTEHSKRMREKWMGGKNYAYLATLVTSPKYRRKGAASQLISAGLALADAHHLPAYVEATPGGLSLYLKHGFEKVDTRTIDMNPWGTPIVQDHTILIRPAASAASPSSISFSPFLTNADFLDFAKIEEKAFQSTPLTRVMLRPPPSPGTPKGPAGKDPLEIRAANLIRMNINDSTVRWTKAFLPETHQMAGWAKWNFYLDPAQPPQRDPMEWPPGVNVALGNRFLEDLYVSRDSRMRGKAYIFMHILAVLPEHQKKGIGKKMLEWGLKQADELGVECWIDATPAGLGLYKQLGWKEVDAVVIDLEPYGGEPGEKEVAVQLIRSPQPLKVLGGVDQQ